MILSGKMLMHTWKFRILNQKLLFQKSIYVISPIPSTRSAISTHWIVEHKVQYLFWPTFVDTRQRNEKKTPSSLGIEVYILDKTHNPTIRWIEPLNCLLKVNFVASKTHILIHISSDIENEWIKWMISQNSISIDINVDKKKTTKNGKNVKQNTNREENPSEAAHYKAMRKIHNSAFQFCSIFVLPSCIYIIYLWSGFSEDGKTAAYMR